MEEMAGGILTNAEMGPTLSGRTETSHHMFGSSTPIPTSL